MSKLDELSKDWIVGIYNRVSTEKHIQLNALENQVQDTRRVVEEAGLTIYRQYVEPESGTEAENRFEYQKMKRDLKNRKFNLLVCKCQDRLCRDQAEWHALIKLTLKYHAKIYFTLSDTIYEHKRDEMAYSLHAIIDAEYSRQTSEKISQHHRMRQLYGTGQDVLNILRPIFGWDRNVSFLDEHTKRVWFTVNEEEADIIRLVMKKLEQGEGFHQIANEMYELGVRSKPTNGSRRVMPHRISETAWRKIVENPLLHGEAVLGKDRKDFYTKERIKQPEALWIHHENVIDPIVSKEYHNYILSKIGTNGRGREYHNRNGKHCLSGKVYCENCGGVYYRVKSKSGTKEHCYWYCSTRKKYGKEECNNPILEEEKLKARIIELKRDDYEKMYMLTEKKLLSCVEKGLKKTQMDSTNIRGRIEEIKKALDEGSFLESAVDNQLLRQVPKITINNTGEIIIW